MKAKDFLRKLLLCTGFVFTILGISVFQMPGTVGAQEEDEYVLEDTVVTATKTGETSLQETSIAVTVFDDQMLADRSTFNMEELLQFTASADMYAGAFGMEGGIRGIGATGIFLVGDNPVSFYLDGVFLFQGRGGNADFLDVERVEILRGPQGVTWGGNATGGAINVITKKPSHELELTAYVEVGNYAKRRVDAMISGPVIKDKMNVRLSVSDSMHDGYLDSLLFEQDIKDENYTAFRGSVQILPSDNVEILIRGDYYKSKTQSDLQSSRLMDFNSPLGQFAASLGYSQEDVIPSDFWTLRQDAAGLWHYEVYGGSVEITIDFPHDITLVSLTGYRRQPHDFWGLDNDETAITELYQEWYEYDHIATWWSQELRLTGTWGRLDWLVGASYMDQELLNPDTAWGPVDYRWATGLPPASPFFTPIIGPEYYGFMERMGIFANLTYDFTDKLSGSAGVRYSDESKELEMHITGEAFLPDGIKVPLFPDQGLHPDITWTAWTPRVGIDYKASEDLFFYAKAENGWRSGNIHPDNYFFLPPGEEGFPLDPEEVWLYEVGMKSDWFHKHLRVNVAVFANDYEDIVISTPLPDGRTAKLNAGTADINGVEIEAIARPTQNLTLNGAVTYLDATYGSALVPNRSGELEDIGGNTVENVPEWKVVLGANYVVPLEGNGFLSFGTDIVYRDAVHWYFFESDPDSWIDDYTLVNARVRYETEDGRWTLEAYGRNIFETKYYKRLTVETGSADTWGRPGDPMTMGIKVMYRY